MMTVPSVRTGLRAFTLLAGLCTSLSMSAFGLGIEELWNASIAAFTYSLSVTDEGSVAVVEDQGNTLGIYNRSGDIYKMWSPPDGHRFSYCEIEGEYVLATYGTTLVLFDDYGREQCWATRIGDLWGTASSLDVTEGLIVTADLPFDGCNSTVYAFDLNGEVLWDQHVPSCITDTAICDGYVAVAGEKSGVMLDEGKHAVYLFSQAGARKWHYETDSPVIDVSLSHGAKHVVAGLDDGSMVYIENKRVLLGLRPRILWELNDIGAYLDLATVAGTVVAGTRNSNLALLSPDGNMLWETSSGDMFGDRDEICIAADGSVIGAVGVAMKWDDNPVRIYDSHGTVLYEEFSSMTRPSVAVSPNGEYIAVATSYRLRLFRVVP